MPRVALFWIGLMFSCPLRIAEAQETPADSVIVKMLGPALVRLLDHEVALAAFGRPHVLKLGLPSSPAWSRVRRHLFVVTNGREPMAQDSAYTALTIRNIRFSVDTVIATFVKE